MSKQATHEMTKQKFTDEHVPRGRWVWKVERLGKIIMTQNTQLKIASKK